MPARPPVARRLQAGAAAGRARPAAPHGSTHHSGWSLLPRKYFGTSQGTRPASARRTMCARRTCQPARPGRAAAAPAAPPPPTRSSLVRGTYLELTIKTTWLQRRAAGRRRRGRPGGNTHTHTHTLAHTHTHTPARPPLASVTAGGVPLLLCLAFFFLFSFSFCSTRRTIGH